MNPAISRAQLNRHLCPILVSLVYKFLKPRHMGWRSKMPAGIKGTLPVIGNRHRRRVNKSKAAFRTLDQIVRLLLRHAAIRITHNAHRRYHQPFLSVTPPIVTSSNKFMLSTSLLEFLSHLNC